MTELLHESQKTLPSEAFLSEQNRFCLIRPVQSVLFGIPDNSHNDNEGAHIINVVNIPGMVIGLVAYDEHMTMEERAEGNVLNTDLIFGRLIPIIRHPICHGAAWTDQTHNNFGYMGESWWQ